MITCLINAVDRASLVQRGSIQVQDQLNGRGRCSFLLSDIAGTYRPEIGQSVSIAKGATTLFAGTIDSLDERREPGTSGLWYQVECVDYSQIADRHIVADVYDAETAGAIIRHVVDDYFVGEAVTYAAVQDGPVISRAVFNYQSAAKVFDRLCELTGYAWWIDYGKDLHFCSRDSVAAPFSLSDSSVNFRLMNVQRSRRQYRNAQYLRAGQDTSEPRTESFAGDGERRTFTVSRPIAKEPTVTLNGGAQTVGIRNVETGYQWYWNKGDNQVSQDDGGVVLGSTDVLAAVYQYLYPILIRADDDAEQAARKVLEGGSGLYEDVREEASVDDTDAAVDLAQGYLRKYAAIHTVVEFETDIDGLAAGQLIDIQVTAHGLAGGYLIDSVTLADPRMQAALRYKVRALGGETLGGWVGFFKAWLQQGRVYVIQENEVLVRAKTFADPLSCTDSITVCTAAPESRIGSARIGFSECA